MENEKNQKSIDRLRYEAPELINYGKFTELTRGAGSGSTDMGSFVEETNQTEPT